MSSDDGGTNKPVWQTVEIEGGPTGYGTKVKIDGEEVNRLARIDAHFGLDEPVSVTLRKYAVVRVKAKAEVSEVFEVSVQLSENDGWKQIAHSVAGTIWEGLYDCGRQLELEAIRPKFE